MKFREIDNMRIDIITVLPEMLEGFVHESILARAQKKGLAEIHLHNLRDYTKDKWRRVDDYPYGGGWGQVMMAQPLKSCLDAALADSTVPAVTTTSMIQSVWQVARPRSPKLQITAAERPTSVA